jgi:hypothetical protein
MKNAINIFDVMLIICQSRGMHHDDLCGTTDYLFLSQACAVDRGRYGGWEATKNVFVKRQRRNAKGAKKGCGQLVATRIWWGLILLHEIGLISTIGSTRLGLRRCACHYSLSRMDSAVCDKRPN